MSIGAGSRRGFRLAGNRRRQQNPSHGTVIASESLHAARAGGEAAAELPKYVYHYTTEATANLIQAGEHLGLQGRTLYLTPNGSLSPTQAGIELALPQTNTAEALFRVESAALQSENISMIRQVTGNVFGRGGGGTEILYNGRVPMSAVTRLQ